MMRRRRHACMLCRLLRLRNVGFGVAADVLALAQLLAAAQIDLVLTAFTAAMGLITAITG